MAGRDDFGSGSKSPGGWGGSGGGGFGGGMGGNKSSSNYNYSSGAGQRGPAIGNWNTGGPVVARANQFGTRGVRLPGGFAGAVSGGLLGGVVRVAARPLGFGHRGIRIRVEPEDRRQTVGEKLGYAARNFGTGGFAGKVIGGLLGPVVRPPQPASLPPAPPVTQEDIPGFRPSIETAPQGIPGTTGYYDMREALGYNPFAGSYPANPGGQFGPRTYNDGYQTMRSDKFQNNPAYGSPGGGLGQYNRQTTVNMNGGPGGYHHSYGGPR